MGVYIWHCHNDVERNNIGLINASGMARTAYIYVIVLFAYDSSMHGIQHWPFGIELLAIRVAGLS